LCSRSSSSAGRRTLRLGRVAGHRGPSGELTVRLAVAAAPWAGLRRFEIAIGDRAPESFEAERVRAYKDRLVLKLRGIDDATAAERLRGAVVSAAIADAPPLPAGTHYAGVLAGLAVVDERGRRLGTVAAVIPTGGTDLLLVKRAGDAEELLIPLARSIVRKIDEAGGRIEVRLPDGLEELNR
jgi:16S rRNA processing protein RimM